MPALVLCPCSTHAGHVVVTVLTIVGLIAVIGATIAAGMRARR